MSLDTLLEDDLFFGGPEPVIGGTSTPIGNISRAALGNYSDYRNQLRIPRIGNTRLANLIRGRAERTAEDQIGRFTNIRKTVGAPRLQDTDLARIINEGLLDPTTTPSFQLGQRLIGERGRTGREQAGEAIRRAGLGGSGLAQRTLSTLGRGEDIDIGNLALQEGVNTRGAAMSFAPQVENAFQQEIARAFGLEREGISDLFSLEQAGQRDFLQELRMALGQEELAKKRQSDKEIQELKNQGLLSLGAGQFGAAAIPRLLDILFGGGGGAGAGGGGGGSSALTGAARQVLQRILGGGGGNAQDITQALVDAGMSQSQADSLIQQILMEDAGELLDVGQFDPSTFLPENNPFLSGGGGGGGFDLSSLGEFDDFGSFFSDFSNAGTGAAGVGGDIAAGGAQTFADIGLDLPFLGGVSLASIPAGIIGGGALAQIMGLFSNAVEKKEKLRSKTFANQYFQQIRRNPQAWANQLGAAWGPQGKQLADAALQGKINNWQDILDVLGIGELKGQLEGIGDSTATSAENGDEILPNLSQWATQYIAAPGEQWHGPILIESNRDKIGQVLELLRTVGPEGLLQRARENVTRRNTLPAGLAYNQEGDIVKVPRDE